MHISLIPAIIGANPVVLTINKRYGVKLALNDLVLLYLIKQYNNQSVVCGWKDIDQVLSLNGRRHSFNTFSERRDRLVGGGFINCRSKSLPYVNLKLVITPLGLIVLAEFERLLLSYKIKGLA